MDFYPSLIINGVPLCLRHHHQLYLSFPRAVYCKNLFSELYVVATRGRRAKTPDILPFRYREKDLLVVGDAILEALPLSHLFTDLIHPSTFQKPVTMAGEKKPLEIYACLASV